MTVHFTNLTSSDKHCRSYNSNESDVSSVNFSIQPKLKIGAPGDKYEQKADSVADQIMRMSENQIQLQSSGIENPMLMQTRDKEGSLQMYPTMDNDKRIIQMQHQAPAIRMKCNKCDEEEKIQMKPTPSVQLENDDSVNDEPSPEYNSSDTDSDSPNIRIDLPTPMNIRVNGVMFTSPTFLLEGPNGNLIDLAPYTGSGFIDFPLAALESLGIPILSFYHFHFGRARQFLGQDFKNAFGLSGGTSFIRNAIHYGYISAGHVELYGAPSSYSPEHYEGLPDLNIVANPMDIGTMINVSYFNNPLEPNENNPTVLFTLTVPFDQNPFEAITNFGGAAYHALSGDLYDLPDVTHNYPGFHSRPNRETGTLTSRTQISPKMKGQGSAIGAQPDLQKRILDRNNYGNSLQPDVREFMEARFEVDFRNVNIHTASKSIQMNQELGSRAFTTGKDIHFNSGEYNPGSSAGIRLLAHELTHVVQQSNENISMIQKQNMPENSVAAPATSAEKRDWVNTLIEFLEMSKVFWEHGSIDHAQLDRVLSGWYRGISTAEDYILNDLNFDMTLRQRLRHAYTTALRLFMTRAAVQLNKPGIRLYLESMHLIPEWAWPGRGDFSLQNQADKRSFIQNTIDLLNEEATFSGYQTFDDAAITDILTRLKNLMDEQLRILVADLNNDATLRTSLITTYHLAVQTLFGRAAPQMGATVSQLAIRYIHLLPDGLEHQVTGISMPIPIGLTPNATGQVVFNLNGFEVTILPDGVKSGSGAETTIDINAGQARWRGSRGSVTSVTQPRAVPRITIQTRYAPGFTAAGQSGYGRGTTAEDRSKGNTSLGFHEGRHGVDFLIFMRNNTPPTFTGTAGMSVADIGIEMERWQQAWRTYNVDMNDFSLQKTDCIGTTLDQFNQGRGQITHECP